MWLATQYGFYSIVKKAGDTYFVRARVRQDLVNLINLLDLDAEVLEWDQADYRYRIVVNAQRFYVIMTKLSTTLDFPTSKAVSASWRISEISWGPIIGSGRPWPSYKGNKWLGAFFTATGLPAVYCIVSRGQFDTAPHN